MRSTLSSRVVLALCTIWLAACAGVKPHAETETGTGGTSPGSGGAGPVFGTGGQGTGGSVVITGLGGSY